MKKYISILSSILITCLLLITYLPAEAATTDKHYYVALGDSLAAGQTPYRTIDQGYPHILADLLAQNNRLDSFISSYAVSGYSTENILEDIRNDVKKEGSPTSIRKALEQATLVTINGGANDLFQFINPNQPDFNPRISNFQKKYTEVGENISLIISEIRELNQDAEIYVLGYYHAFPYLSNVQQQPLILLTNYLNQTLAAEARHQQVTFVPVFDAIAKDYATYLPNPADIHLSVEGYEVMADLLYEAIMKRAMDPNQSPTTFTDLPNTHWANDPIQRLFEKGVLSGYPDQTFKPNNAVTRGEGVSMLFRMMIMDTKMPIDPNFLDVSDNHYAYIAIAKLTETGIIDGFNQLFKPDQPLTRAEVAKLIVTGFNLIGSTEHSFVDVHGNHWAKEYIGILVQNGIIGGYPDQTFRPNQSISRAEIASILSKVTN